MTEKTPLLAAIDSFREDVKPDADTIVVCDDEEMLRRLIGRSIRRVTDSASAKINVVEFPNAESALSLLADEPHAKRILAVVSDRNMGRGLKGEDFARALRDDLQDSETPFLMQTSDVHVPTVISSFTSGRVDALLEKPFDGENLVAAIAHAITARLEKVEAEALTMATLEV